MRDGAGGRDRFPRERAVRRRVTVMLSPEEHADIVVTVAHAWGDLEVPLETWIRTGPGPRPYAGIIAARRLSTGAEVALIEIPQEYHNSPEARSLQRQGLLPRPWGPPPNTEP